MSVKVAYVILHIHAKRYPDFTVSFSKCIGDTLRTPRLLEEKRKLPRRDSVNKRKQEADIAECLAAVDNRIAALGMKNFARC